jgi:hypothetical protein
MPRKMRISDQEELKLARSFEFGAYVMITQYLARAHGPEELRRFARFWAKAAAATRRTMLERSRKSFLAAEARIEKVWVGRETTKLNDSEYAGIVKACPIRALTNRNRAALPIDYFCDHICSIIYPKGYRLLGLNGRVEKTKDGCVVEIVS